jgi:hypothetical protein
MLNKTLSVLKKYFYRPKWQNIEYFDADWKKRICKMAELIGDEKVILDLGCGKMWLRQFLGPEKVYLGCDYVKRDADTIVCDFNKYQFPDCQADLCFVSGCLEYVEDLNWFFDEIARHALVLVVSYCTYELSPDIRLRKSLGWVNH